MLQRMTDQHKISFLDKSNIPDIPKKTVASEKKEILDIVENQRSKKLNNKDNGIMTSRNICSARTGEISDNGGPAKYIKGETSNTLWDSEKTSKITTDSKENTVREKDIIASNKRHAEQKRMDKMIEELRTIDQTKAVAVSSAGSYSGSNYKSHPNNMSIFDTKDFERLPDKTAGEQVVDDNKTKKSQKDESWKSGGKSISVQEAVSDYFNQLLKKEE